MKYTNTVGKKSSLILDNLHGTKGNVTENLHDIYDEVDKLVGKDATAGSLARQRTAIGLLEVIDAVRKESVRRSADWYMKAMDYIQLKQKELQNGF